MRTKIKLPIYAGLNLSIWTTKVENSDQQCIVMFDFPWVGSEYKYW